MVEVPRLAITKPNNNNNNNNNKKTCSLLTGVVGPFPNGRNPWLINGGSLSSSMMSGSRFAIASYREGDAGGRNPYTRFLRYNNTVAWCITICRLIYDQVVVVVVVAVVAVVGGGGVGGVGGVGVGVVVVVVVVVLIIAFSCWLEMWWNMPCHQNLMIENGWYPFTIHQKIQIPRIEVRTNIS